MPANVDVENAFGEFVREHGGEVIEDFLPASPDFPNADYLFREMRVVAELKRLVENKSEDENIQAKIQQKFDRWMSNGTIGPIYGRLLVQSHSLPEHCQRELIEIYRPPIQKRVIKANKQIKATLNRLKVDNGKGLLILVNDGNYALEADAVLYLLHRILGTRFRYINSAVYCTVNMYAKSPVTTKPTLVWAHATRKGVAPVDEGFVLNLFRGWRARLERIRGEPVEEILVNDFSVIESVKYVKGI